MKTKNTMKTKTTLQTLSISVCSLLATLSASADGLDIRLADCPAAVQTTIQNKLGNGRLDEVERLAIEGKEIYIAKIDLPGNHDLRIYIDGAGKMVKMIEEIAAKKLPDAVRTALEKIGGRLDDIEKISEGETVTYQVEIDRHGSPDLHVTVSADGKILEQTQEIED